MIRTADDSEQKQSSSVRHRSLATVVIASLLCLYWLALFYGTHAPLPPGALPGNADKVIHFVSYAGLGGLLLSLRATRGSFIWTSIVGRWLFLAFYGAFDEITQAFVNRTPDLEDWYADIAGAALGLACVAFTYRIWRKPQKLATEIEPNTQTS